MGRGEKICSLRKPAQVERHCKVGMKSLDIGDSKSGRLI